MALETLALIQQLQQKPNFEKLTNQNTQPKTEQFQKIAAIRPKLPPNFLIKNKQDTLQKISPDTGFVEIQKLEYPEFSFERDSKFEPVGLTTKNYICSASILTQIVKGLERKYVVTIGHCLSDEMKLLLGDNIQILTNPKLNYQEAEFLDPAIAIPLKVFGKLSNKIKIVPLLEYIDLDVKKLMNEYKTSSNCDISTPNINIYNTNFVTQIENPEYPERAFRKGLDAVISKPGASGGTVLFEGKTKEGEICFNPKLMSSHGRSMVGIPIDSRMLTPRYRGDFPATEIYTKLKSGQINTTLNEFKSQSGGMKTKAFRDSGFINLTTPFGIISEAHYKTSDFSKMSTFNTSEQIDKLRSPHKLIESANIQIDGKEYRITRHPDKIKPDIITEVKIEKDNFENGFLD